MHSRMTVFDCVVISRKIACSAARLSPAEPARAIEQRVLVDPVACSFFLIILYWLVEVTRKLSVTVSWMLSQILGSVSQKNSKIAAVKSS